MKLLKGSLSNRAISFFLLAAIVPQIVSGLIFYFSGRYIIANNIESHLKSVSIIKEQELLNWEKHLGHTIFLLTKSPRLIQDAALATELDPGEKDYHVALDSLRSIMSQILSLGHISHIFFLDGTSGQVIASSEKKLEGQFKDSEQWFSQGKTGLYISDIFHSLALERPTMAISAPITDNNGQFYGVLVGFANLEELSEIMLERSGLGETGQTYLVNKDNLLITESHKNPDFTFKEWIFTEGVIRALGGDDSTGQYVDYADDPVIGAYRWIASLELVIVAEMDQAEAYEPIRRLGITMAIFGGSVLLVGALAAYGFAQSIIRPIQHLATGAEELGKGNLDFRIESNSEDEIGQLTKEFNRMAASIHDKDTQLQQRAKSLATANKEMESFSYSISHDLRTPLRAMSGFSKILIDEYESKLTEDAKGYLKKIQWNSLKMSSLIDDLLHFSRIGRQKLKTQIVSAEDIVKQALEELEGEQAGRKIRLNVGKLPVFQADPALMKQVFVNLLSNAFKFTEKKKIAIIEIGSEKNNKETVYFIRDNGVGFDMRYAEKLFGVFQRLHSEAEFEGTGVGLAISQSIIHRHGGRVWAEAEVGKGATFYFTLGGKDGR